MKRDAIVFAVKYLKVLYRPWPILVFFETPEVGNIAISVQLLMQIICSLLPIK